MTILITGNMGYVGSFLVKHLSSNYKNIKLIGFDNGYFRDCLTNTSIAPESLIEHQYFGDIRKISSDVLNGIDHIIHLAAISNDPIGNQYKEVTTDINFNSTINLAKLAVKSGVKSFTLASSCSIYGNGTNDSRTETCQTNPLTAYAKSKILSENKLQELASDKFKVTSLRFSTACGVSDRLRLDLVLNDFVASAFVQKKIQILSDGSPWRPIIDILDMARAFDWAINRNIKDSGNYLIVNIGQNRNNVQIKDLAYMVKDHFPDTKVKINSNAEPDKRSYKVDFSLFNSLAPEKYLPQESISSTIQRIKKSLEEMNFSDLKFRESELMRLVKIKNLRNENKLNEKLEWIN
ncbi:MAG: SDR family oxidoreductase [Ignavibacteriae bacterium]|nr:SDR family oxidoreductase [Ignavibacteriota bacterium]